MSKSPIMHFIGILVSLLIIVEVIRSRKSIKKQSSFLYFSAIFINVVVILVFFSSIVLSIGS